MLQVQRHCVMDSMAMAAVLTAQMEEESNGAAAQVQSRPVAQIEAAKTRVDGSDIATVGDREVMCNEWPTMCLIGSSYAYSNTNNKGVLSLNYKNRAEDAVRFFEQPLKVTRIGTKGIFYFKDMKMTLTRETSATLS